MISLVSGPVLQARADTRKDSTDQEEPIEPLAADEEETELDELDELIAVESLVIEALKTSSTVEEAPAIITVVSSEDLQAMGHRSVAEAMQDIPSFLHGYPWYHSGRAPLSRGIFVGSLVLHNGVDIYSSGVGATPLEENIPMESLKRLEVMSGPGGVLWGANSFVGVINMVSKTADDIDGVEASAGWGSGKGYPNSLRGYVMGGTKLLDNRLKIFAHASYETFHAPELWFPSLILMRTTYPQPTSPHYMTVDPVISKQPRSHMGILEGNIQLDPVSLYWHVTLSHLPRPSSFGGNAALVDREEDSVDCTDPANKNACLSRVDPRRISRSNTWDIGERYGMLRYRDGFFDGKLKLEGRAYYVQYLTTMVNYVSIPPSEILTEGVSVNQDFSGHRTALTLDADAKVFGSNRLLFGGMAIYEWQPDYRADFQVSPSTLDRLPIRPACPPDTGGRRCPIVVTYASNRLNLGLFADWWSRLHDTLVIDVGARLAGAAGKRPVDPLALFSGAAVWTFRPNWNLKINYAEGFRPPALQRTDSNGEGLTWAGNPEMEIERSRSIQGEINARLFSGHGVLRSISTRVDYAYTWITDIIGVHGGINQNLSDLGIHSVEFLSDIRLKRNHWIALSYTFLDITDSLNGKMRSIPNQWFNVRGLFNLWARRFFLSSNLTIIGAFEDFNRVGNLSAGMVHIGNLDADGQPERVPVRTARISDMVIDRGTPFALWNVGLRFLLPRQHLRLDADVYNVLDTRGFQAEWWMDPSATMESIPTPRPGMAFFLRAQVSY